MDMLIPVLSLWPLAVAIVLAVVILRDVYRNG